MACVVYGIIHLYSQVYPEGISKETNCEEIWEAFTPGSATLGNSDRINILWKCGERNTHMWQAFALYCAVWIALKSFAIPGSMILCVALGGFMENDMLIAQVIATVCETFGGSLCFGLSSIVGKPLLSRCFPRLLEKFKREMDLRRDNMMYFSMFVRISPLVPNWFVNCAAPVVGIRFFPEFIVSLLVGTQVGVFLSLRTGALLFLLIKSMGTADGSVAESGGDALLQTQAVQNFVVMMVAQFIALIPVYWTKQPKVEGKIE